MRSNPWRKDLAGGVAAAFSGLPIELVYGLLAVAPLGAAYVGHGLRAGLWACVLAGVLGVLLRTTGGMVAGSRPAAGLLLGALAAMLLEQGAIQASPDPAATVFVLLLLCTALAGLLQCIFGLAGVGSALKYVPYPVIAGLMCGVGLLMAKSALKPFLGLSASQPWSAWMAGWHPSSVLVGGVTLILCFRASRWTRRIPGVVLALVGGSLLHHLLAALLGPAFMGPTSSSAHGLIPTFSVWQTLEAGSALSVLAWVPSLLPYAAAIAAFASLENLLCLASIESVKGVRSDGDRELVRQGLVNVVGGVLGATPSVGVPARVAANLMAGGRTPLSGASYSATLALVVIFAGQWSSLVPAAVTAGILLFFAQTMLDEGTRRMARQVIEGRSEMSSGQYRTLLSNLGVVVLVALVATVGQMLQAMVVGVVAAMFLFVKTSMKPVIRLVSNATLRRSLKVRSMLELESLDAFGTQIVTIDVDGPLFFGTADRAALEIEKAAHHAGWVILDLKRVGEVDATGARTLLRISDRLAREKKSLLLCGMNERLRDFLGAMGLPQHRENWLEDMDAALERAEDALLASQGVLVTTASVSLGDTVLAEGLREDQLQVLACHLVTGVFEAGDYVFRKGDQGGSLYIAGDSAVDIVLMLEGQRHKRLASLAPGHVFGEMALLDGKPRSADAIVQRRSVVWELTRAQLHAIEAAHPEIVARLLLNLSHCLADRVRARTRELSALLEAA